MEIFTVQHRGAGLPRGMDNHGVPERNPAQAVQLNGGDHIVFVESHDVAAGQNFYLPLRNLGVYTELSGGRREIFLHHLQGHYRRIPPMVISNDRNGARLLLRTGVIVGVDQNIGIEEGQTFHRRSCNSSRSNFQPFELPCAACESRSNSAASAAGSVFPASC